jgi:hypothetical protein
MSRAKRKSRRHPVALLLTATVALLLAACGGRNDFWDANVQLPVQTLGLSGSVAVVDPSLDRVLMISASGRKLSEKALEVGKNIVAAKTSPDKKTLFVLSSGVQPRKKPGDERPSLTVIDGGTKPRVEARFQLTDPLQGLAIDPEGEWAVVYDAGGVVVNPNELIFVNLKDTSQPPYPKTIRSFGGRPERFTFTSSLSLPKGGSRRMLIVETDQDVTLIDLAHLDRDEVTVAMPKTPTGDTAQPAEVAYNDGDPKDNSDARIAVRLANDSSVLLLQLGPPKGSAKQDYFPTPNIADVGGVPTAIDFVETDGGLRLAALVPGLRQASLVDPATTVVEAVDLSQPYTRLTRVTQDVTNKPTTSDVALLWSDQTSGVAFWSLGKTTGTPFRSVDPYDIGIAVKQVIDVPGDSYAHLKILQSTSDAEFYVLDLDKRETYPMLTNQAGFELSMSPDGQRVWAFRPGSPDFARIDLSDLHPTSLTVERDVSAVYDIERLDGGRALLAMHESGDGMAGALGATVLDAVKPDTADSSFYGGLMLGGAR